MLYGMLKLVLYVDCVIGFYGFVSCNVGDHDVTLLLLLVDFLIFPG